MSDTPSTSVRFARARRISLPVVLWAFGFATSLLLIGMWGRVVAVDTATVEETARVAVDSELARDRAVSWLEDALALAATADSDRLDDVAQSVTQRPEFDAAVDILVADVVAGLFAEQGEGTELRLEAAVAPLVPVIESELDRADVPFESEPLEAAVDAVGEIALDTGEAQTVARAVREAQTFLTWVVLVASSALALLAILALTLAERRYAMLRTLSTRVVLSALTYALLFRVASWALDPDRGRSPVIGGGAVVLGSNGHVFLIAAAVAGVVAAIGGVVAWRRTRLRKGSVASTPAVDDDTRELAAV